MLIEIFAELDPEGRKVVIDGHDITYALDCPVDDLEPDWDGVIEVDCDLDYSINRDPGRPPGYDTGGDPPWVEVDDLVVEFDGIDVTRHVCDMEDLLDRIVDNG